MTQTAFAVRGVRRPAGIETVATAHRNAIARRVKSTSQDPVITAACVRVTQSGARFDIADWDIILAADKAADALDWED